MFAALVALTLAIPAAPQEKEKPKELPEAAKKELKALEGKWKIVKGANSQGEAEIEAGQEFFLIFKGDEITMENGNKKEVVKVTAVDGGTDPKCIDLLEKREGRPDRIVEGVYKVEKDTLQLALHTSTADAKQRPTGFDKPTDTRTMVWTLKRVKE